MFVRWRSPSLFIYGSAADLHHAFPEVRGFSPRNLKYMRAFAAAYPAREFVQAPLAQITWYHHVTLLDKVKIPEERLWYAGKAVEQGWSRDIMALQIDTDLFHRQGRAVTNFARTLPSPQSDLAQQVLKDPYVFDFLTLADDARERELERTLLEHLTYFLLELGAGFAFVGRQVRLEVGAEDFSTGPQHQLKRALPTELRPSLPTIEEIEGDLGRDLAQAIPRESEGRPRKRE